MSLSSRQGIGALRNWFVVAGLAVLALVFFLGALNTFRQESVAAEGSAYPSLSAPPKTIFVVCRPAGDGTDASISADMEPRFQTLMHVVGPSGVDAIFTAGPVGNDWDLQRLTDPDGSGIETERMASPNTMAKALLSSEHRILLAVVGGDSIVELLSGLGVTDLPRIGDACDDLLVVTTDAGGRASLVHLRY